MVNFYRENMESGKNIIMVCLAMLGCTCYTVSQNYISGTVYNNGNAYCSATLNNAGTFVNKTGGNFYVTGDITNSGTTAYDGGTLLFAGNTMQSSGGSAIFYTTNVSFNNSAGIAVSKCMSVNSTATFASGLVTTPSGSVEPLEFTSPAVSAGTSNASHVNGYVRTVSYTHLDITDLLGIISNNLPEFEKLNEIIGRIEALNLHENDPARLVVADAKNYIANYDQSNS